MRTWFGLLVRNRRVHLLAGLVALFFVAFSGHHALQRGGIYVGYDEPQFQYKTVVATINDNFFVTDVKVQRCLRGFTCDPPLLALRSWHQHRPRLNLFLGFSFFHYYLSHELTHGNDAPRFVSDVRFSALQNPPYPPKELQVATQKISSGAYLHVYYTNTQDPDAKYVRDLMVLYGGLDLKDGRPHWEFQEAPVTLPVVQTVPAHLTLLKISVNEEMDILSKELVFDLVYKKNEVIALVEPKFKFLQISDLHYGQDAGLCDDTECKLDQTTVQFINDVLNEENDVRFVIISGDMIDIERVKHFPSAALKALLPFLERKIPFVFLFGDLDYVHDPLDPMSKASVLQFISLLPLCYNQDRRMRVGGLTNGNIKIIRVDPHAEQNHELLDIGSPLAIITYLDLERGEMHSSHSKYLYRITSELDERVRRLLFFHHPLPNFRPLKAFKMIGEYNEKHPLALSTEAEFLEDVRRAKYAVVGVGHEHTNDGCIWDEVENGEKVILCYTGAAGELAKTANMSGFKRRLRVFELDFDHDRLLSWKRVMPKEAIDPQSIYDYSDV